MPLNDSATPHKSHETLTFARRYLQRGLAVIPLRPDSKAPPHNFRWKQFREHAPHEAALIHWFGTLYPVAQIAVICCGGLVVVDVDPRNGGDQSIKGFPIPKTPTVISGGGGLHYWFRSSVPLGTHELLTGVDFKAEKSYIIAPPSIHYKTRKPYTWAPGLSLDDVEIAPLPDWALERVLVLDSLSKLRESVAPLPAEAVSALTDDPICIKALESGR